MISADTQLINGLLDSIEVIELLSSLEDAFGIIIPSQEIKADNFMNIETIEMNLKICGELHNKNQCRWRVCIFYQYNYESRICH